jgi:hypothetical protein
LWVVVVLLLLPPAELVKVPLSLLSGLVLVLLLGLPEVVLNGRGQ